MENFKKFLSGRAAGYYLLFSAIVLELIFAILYPVFFSRNFQMSWTVFSLALLTFLVGIVLLVIPFFCQKTEKWCVPITPFIIFGLSLITLFMFAPVCYGLTSLGNLMDILAQMIICVILLLISSILATVAVFKRQIKKQKQVEIKE